MHSWYDEIHKIKEWIDQNIENDISLTSLSAHMGYSSFYLSKKFSQLEGITLKEYMVISRIQHAAHQLAATEERILDVAVRHGYSSQEAFTRAFIKVLGITPWSYRKMQRPLPGVNKSRLLCSVGYTNPMGGTDMKIYVKQMYDWNYYGYYAEQIEEKYWDYFKSELWWQVGDSFIKTYDNVEHFEYCAANFTKYGEAMIKQQLGLLPAPWEPALAALIPLMKEAGVDWYIHGSAAMALWGIDVAPKNLNIIIPNYSDFDKVRSHLYPYAVRPFERCENWLMSGLGDIFIEAKIGVAFHNRELEPYDISRLERIHFGGGEVYLEDLETLRQDNERFNRPERVRLIEERLRLR